MLYNLVIIYYINSISIARKNSKILQKTTIKKKRVTKFRQKRKTNKTKLLKREKSCEQRKRSFTNFSLYGKRVRIYKRPVAMTKDEHPVGPRVIIICFDGTASRRGAIGRSYSAWQQSWKNRDVRSELKYAREKREKTKTKQWKSEIKNRRRNISIYFFKRELLLKKKYREREASEWRRNNRKLIIGNEWGKGIS